MGEKSEILPVDKSENELDPGIQALADMADKMGENSLEPEYDENDFDSDGYNKDGINKRGFYKNGIHKDTGEKRDQWGYDKWGLNKLREDYDGFFHSGKGGRLKHQDGYYHPEDFGKDGFDSDGYDREGYDRKGYDYDGYDKDGYSREYNAKFNKFGVDENGRMKNGEMDSDVEFAIGFAESGEKDLNRFAAEKGMDGKEVRDRIALARKKCPNIDKIIKNLLLTGNKMRFAAISIDCKKFIGGELSMNEFWDKHSKLNISDVLSNFIDSPGEKKQFSDRVIENLNLDSKNVEGILRIFGVSQHDVSGALKGVEDFKKVYTRFSTDGTSEQIKKKQENTKKIFDTIKYLNRYKDRKLDSLLGSRQSFDGGQTWIEFNEGTIGQAVDTLKKDNKLVCVQTVRDYIIDQSKS